MKQMIRCVVVALVLAFDRARACIFDCHYSRTVRPTRDDGSVCAGLAPSLVQVDLDSLSQFPSFIQIIRHSATIQVLDLKGRGITSIAQGGFSCYEFIPYTTSIPYTPLNEVNTSADTNLQVTLRGVAMDGNRLSVLPDLKSVGLENATFVSAIQNEIEAVEGAPYIVNMVLILELDENNLQELPSLLFQRRNNYQLGIASFRYNNISEIPTGFFNYTFIQNQYDSNPFDSTISLAFNRIKELKSGWMVDGGEDTGYVNGDITLDLKANNITEIDVGIFYCGESLSNPVTIDLTLNQIEHVPAYIFNSTNQGIQTLFLDYNQVSDLDRGVFYTSTGGVENILHLSHNQITGLPSGLMSTGDSSQDICCQQTELVVSYNQITAIEDDIFSTGNLGDGTTLVLSHNQITYVTNDLVPNYAYDGGSIYLYVDNNELSALKSPLININSNKYYGLDITLDLSRNHLTSLPDAICYANLTDTSLYWSICNITFANNNITSIPPGFFSSLALTYSLMINVDENKLKQLDDGLFNSSEDNVGRLDTLTFSAINNDIDHVGQIFYGMPHIQVASVDLSQNRIATDGLVNVMKEFRHGNRFILTLTGNHVSELPSLLFANVGSALYPAHGPVISLNLQNNEIRNVSSSLFAPGPSGSEESSFYVNLTSLTIDVSENPLLTLPDIPFWFGIVDLYNNVNTQITNNLNFVMQRTGQTRLPLNLFGAFGFDRSICTNYYSGGPEHSVGPTLDLAIDLSYNNISDESLSYEVSYPYWYSYDDSNIEQYEPFPINFTALSSCEVRVSLNLTYNNISTIPPNSLGGFYGVVDLAHNILSMVPELAFRGSSFDTLNMSNNDITMLSTSAFNFSMHLDTLKLDHNRLTSFPVGFVTNTPILRVLSLIKNNLLSLPENGATNRMFDPSAVQGNPLQCASYVPMIQNCTCSGGLVFSTFCQYARCTETSSGCKDSEQRPLGSCDEAPESQCISECPFGQYLGQDTLAVGEAACTLYTDCSKAFGTNPGYQFAPPTKTTDRVCAPCSNCPAGFDSKPCTSTKNTVCTKTDHLTNGDISAIALSLVLMFAIGVGGTSYTFLRKKKAGTERELELSQLLLGEVKVEFAEVAEDNERMKQAWEISENDLILKKKISEGSFGEVWAGDWGHIGVAVKLLHEHFASSEEDIADFNREATFMQTIKHPNLLIFYGAGVRQDGRPFLVVELMIKGSMRSLIMSEDLAWSTRQRFAFEVAKGMAHLHGLGSMHRDLKSDNCLVDAKYHVKVGDFGNSRLKKAYRQRQLYAGSARASGREDTLSSRQSSNAITWNSRKSLTTGVGTPLWMAPELITGEHDYGNKIDVYSYGVVMWELLTRGVPWEDEIEDTRNHHTFKRLLTEALLSGRRPTIPSWADAPEYRGFIEIMLKAWDTNPDQRPSFTEVVDTFHQFSD